MGREYSGDDRPRGTDGTAERHYRCPVLFRSCLQDLWHVPGFQALGQKLIALASLSAVSCLWGIGSGPAPARATMAPQNGWSPKKGTTKVGRPAVMPAAVVPAPP